MTEPLLIARQRTLLRDLFRLAAERAREERVLVDDLATRLRKEGDGDERAAAPPAGRPARKLPQCVAEAERLVGDLRERVVPRDLQRRRLLTGFGLLAPALVFPLGWLAVWLGGLEMALGMVIGAGAVAGPVRGD